jgi:TPP-dependent pyruvate/acetoin dehydrogenase alpha subunit
MYDKNLLIRMYEVMLRIRRFEETAVKLFANNELPGWLHSYIGEEAVAAGVCLALGTEDYITSTHRGHGHCIAKGASLKKMMAELYAKESGYCRARGGSMHIADFKIGIMGANGIVGGGIPIATGIALGCQIKELDRVTVCFFSDGAANQGGFHESLNLASIWKLPIVYVCENNLYAESTPQSQHQHITDIAQRAVAFDMRNAISDGMDVISVYEQALAAVNYARSGQGPSLLECKTYRFRGHWEGDPQPYRSKDEVAAWQKKDSINRLGTQLIKEDILTKERLIIIDDSIKQEIKEAIEFAKNSPAPNPAEVSEGAFA